ncbi:MAG: hypothetical protein AB1353_07790 [Aquificota bacterium]
MKKYIALIILLTLIVLSFALSVLYFSNPNYRKEKIDSYKHEIDKRLHRR